MFHKGVIEGFIGIFEIFEFFGRRDIDGGEFIGDIDRGADGNRVLGQQGGKILIIAKKLVKCSYI